jgi:hypothetical protein
VDRILSQQGEFPSRREYIKKDVKRELARGAKSKGIAQ